MIQDCVIEPEEKRVDVALALRDWFGELKLQIKSCDSVHFERYD